MFTAGILLVLAFILIMIKLNKTTVKRLLSFDIGIDIVVTATMAWLLAGTYSGMMAAIVGGLLFSVFLYIVKQTMGYEKLTRDKCSHCNHTSFKWTAVKGKFQKQRL